MPREERCKAAVGQPVEVLDCTSAHRAQGGVTGVDGRGHRVEVVCVTRVNSERVFTVDRFSTLVFFAHRFDVVPHGLPGNALRGEIHTLFCHAGALGHGHTSPALFGDDFREQGAVVEYLRVAGLNVLLGQLVVLGYVVVVDARVNPQAHMHFLRFVAERLHAGKCGAQVLFVHGHDAALAQFERTPMWVLNDQVTHQRAVVKVEGAFFGHHGESAVRQPFPVSELHVQGGPVWQVHHGFVNLGAPLNG